MLNSTKKSTLYEVILNNEDASYNPGDKVEGIVRIHPYDHDKKIKEIEVTLSGQARTKWITVSYEQNDTGGEYDNGDPVQATGEPIETEHGAKQNLVHSRIGLLNGEVKMLRPNANHSFPFSFDLPAELPSSLKLEKAKIEYSIEANVKKAALLKRDKKATKEINVTNRVDFNRIPNAMAPLVVGGTLKTSKILFKTTGSLEASMALERRGYHPGETITVKLDIDESKNSKEIPSRSLALRQTVEVTGAKKNDTDVESRIVRTAAFEAGAKTASLEVPGDLTSSVMPGCSIIDVRYQLELQVQVEKANKKVCDAPIIIGSEQNTSEKK